MYIYIYIYMYIYIYIYIYIYTGRLHEGGLPREPQGEVRDPLLLSVWAPSRSGPSPFFARPRGAARRISAPHVSASGRELPGKTLQL